MPAQPNQYPALTWCKSSASSGATDCVEVACLDSSVLVRDSGDKSGAVLKVTSAQWRGFLRDVKDRDAGRS
jgi:hypothetical protein